MDFTDAELERALVDLGQHLSYPPVLDLSQTVRAHLEQHPRRVRSFRGLVIRRAVLVPVLAALAILATVLALSPDARSAIASWFHLGGVVIQSGSSPPGPLGHNLNLGRRLSLADAQKRVPFRILTPSLPGLGTPDEIYVGTPPFSGRVSLIYRSRRGLPRASTTGAGLLITEMQSRFFVGKTIPPGTTMSQVGISGEVRGGFAAEQGVWLAGRPHFLYYFSEQGRLLRDTIRLAGNVLAWDHGKVALRIEGHISEERAVEIARSMETGTPH
jgi:hypothetical protein